MVRTVHQSLELPEFPSGISVRVHRRSGGILGAALRSSGELASAIQADASSGAILHAHGLWLMPNIYPARAKKISRFETILVHSPRGMLARDAMVIAAWKKWPFWLLMQKWALQSADCLHATALSEYEEIRSVGLMNPVAVMPNGIDLPPIVRRVHRQERTLLSLGRVHPKKGLDRLIRAWSQVEAEFPNWRLRIVGPAELDHDTELKAIAHSLNVRRLRIERPLFGDDKWAAFRSAECFVLPTLNENFGLTVAEALASELPVISTQGAPWSRLVTERCGWWIEHGVEPLVGALRAAMSMPRAELHVMGARGREWMHRDFSWARIAGDMLQVYQWLRFGGRVPDSVRLK